MMKSTLPILATLLLIGTSASAALRIDGRQANRMDEARSLGVIYINHDFATASEAHQALRDEAEAHGARYYHEVFTHQPESNGLIHASADIYR